MKKFKSNEFKIRQLLQLFTIVMTTPIFANPDTWQGTSSNHDINEMENWSSGTVPTPGDDAIFNSKLHGISTNPTGNSNSLSVETFQFPNKASVFHFDLDDYQLEFNGSGIVGGQTNTTINLHNNNHVPDVPYQLFFSGMNNTSGKAILSISNILSEPNIGSISSAQMTSSGNFTILSNGNISIDNQGTASGEGSTATIGNNQLDFGGTLTAQSGVGISISNIGTFDGTSNSGTTNVGTVVNAQFHANDNIVAEKNFNLNVSNSGSNTNAGNGTNQVGYLGYQQVNCQSDLTVGSNSMITVSNNGENNGTGSAGSRIGYYTSDQLYVGGDFQLDANSSLKVSNSGTDNSTGIGGHYIAVINTNSGDPTDGGQVYIAGTTNLQSNIDIEVTNAGAFSGQGQISPTQIGVTAGPQTIFGGEFTAADNLKIKVTNSGTDSSQTAVAGGNNSTGNITGAQLEFGLICPTESLCSATCTVGNYAEITAHNNGNFSGGNTLNFSYVGAMGPNQLLFTDDFTALDNLTLKAENVGIHTGTELSHGASYVGYMNQGYQANFLEDCSVGANATIEVKNHGENSSNTSNGTNVASLNRGGQIGVAGEFHAGESLNLTISNYGENNSSGSGGNYVSFSNDGVHQLFLGGSVTIDKNSTMTLSNTAISSGTTGNNLVSSIQDQLYNGAPMTVPAFNVGDNYHLTITNTGTDTSTGPGNNTVAGLNAGCQANFTGTFTAQDNATIEIANAGTNGGNASGGNNVGFMTNCQFLGTYPSSAEDGFNLTVTNTGINGTSDSSGSGNNNVARVGVSQVQFNNSLTVNDAARISISNRGTNAGTATTLNQVGVVGNFQFQTAQTLTAGNSFYLNVSNDGNNSGNSAGSDSVGLILTYSQVSITPYDGSSVQVGNDATFILSNNGTDSTVSPGSNTTGCVAASQFESLGTFIAADKTSLTISNNGAFNGSNASTGNLVGCVGAEQFYGEQAFTVLDNLEVNISNAGDAASTGMGGNQVGYISASQMAFDSSFQAGDNAKITITNAGTNSSASTGNYIGYVADAQFSLSGSFTAGSNLNMSATNTASNVGNIDNHVGEIATSQIQFGDSVTIGDGSIISASNSGTVGTSQIVFNQGFNIIGSATLQASNQGTIGSYGIDVLGDSSGGNANIVLENSSLHINTSPSSFTIGQLNGDSTSIVQSMPTLIINMDPLVHANFAGDIQNYPSSVSSLMITGSGTQQLSGSNSYTGSTTVQGGTLLLTGSVMRDVSVSSAGTIKGTGTIGRNLINAGTIAPGQSIGTLHVNGNFTNNGGTYDLEVGAARSSDLIAVGGTAQLNGGTVLVSSPDGLYTFQEPYVIVDAGHVTGTFSRATPVSPFLRSTLTYDPQHVYLTLQTAIDRSAKTCNQLAVAQRLDDIVGPDTNQTLLLSELVDLSTTDAPKALNSLAGSQHTDDLWTTQTIGRQFIRRLYDPIRSLVTDEPCCYWDPCCECDWTAWLETGGEYSQLHGNENAYGLTMSSFQFTAGTQKTFCSCWTGGIAGSYEYDSLHYNNRGGSGQHNNWLIGLYGLYRPSGYYGLLDVTYGYSHNKINRSINVGSLHYTASSKPTISQAMFYGEIGADFELGCVLVQPFGGIEVGSSWRDSVTEHQTQEWGLSIHKKNWTTVSSRVGLHLTMNDVCANIDCVLDIAWNKILSNRRNNINGKFKDFGGSYKIQGINLDANSIDYALTLSSFICPGLRGYLEFTGESWQHFTSLNGLCGIEFSW